MNNALISPPSGLIIWIIVCSIILITAIYLFYLMVRFFMNKNKTTKTKSTFLLF